MTIDIKELEKHEEITSVSFDHENAHLASTHFMQGGAASGWNQALLLKSDEIDTELTKALEQVTVTLSLEEFLRRFFNMYHEDAEVLTKIMGYQTEEEYAITHRVEDEPVSYEDWYSEWIDEKTNKVQLLEKAQDSFEELTTEEKIKLLSIQESLEKGLLGHEVQDGDSDGAATDELEKNSKEGVALETSTEESEEVSSAIGSDNLEDEINKSEGENISMTKQVGKTTVELELEKAQEKLAELEKAQEKLAELEKAKEKLAELEKAAQERAEALEKAQQKLVEFEKAEAKRIEKGYQSFAETLSFVEEKEELVGFLMKAREVDVENAAKFVEYLEKASEAIAAFGEEKGFEGAEDEEIAKASHKLLDEKIEAKYANKKWLS